MTAYYNEHDAYPADWIENLAQANHISPGTVDRRDIRDVRPADLAGFTRTHFFAGIGGWDYALRLAGWPADTAVWTGSCPCQPFSAAGRRKGTRDDRHLWPEWFRLIAECRPPVVFGEQVASADGLGWLDAVCADLENAGYACGAADLCAAGAGAPHIRQRLYFVAHTPRERHERVGMELLAGQPRQENAQTQRRGQDGLADALPAGRPERRPESGDRPSAGGSSNGDVVHADEPRPQGRIERGHGTDERLAGPAGLGFWSAADWIPCRDEKRGVVGRPVEPGTFPLAHGVPGRVGRLRAYGNAIVPQVAAIFIRAVMEDLHL